MTTNVMNGPVPQQTVQGGLPRASGPPRLSVALIRGAQQLTELFEKRTAVLRADYEERIRALATQRDALFAASQGQTSQGPTKAADESELEALRAERSVLLRERADREQERAEWNKERVMAQAERANWNEERLMVEIERARWDEERTMNNVACTRWEENTLHLSRERDSLLEEREQCRRIRKDLENELSRVRHELQVSKAGYGSLQEQLASRNASVMALETRVRQSEEAGAPGVRARTNADGTEDQQEVFNPIAFIRSPARSMTLPTISAQSTTLSLKSPSLDPMSTQLDGPAPPSPTVTFRLDSPPSPIKSSVADSIHDDSPITDFPTLVEGSSGSRSATPVMTTPPRRLIIRIPPSAENTRKSLKPSPPRFTEEERRSIVHVPRQPEFDDDEDGLDTTSDAAKTIQDP